MVKVNPTSSPLPENVRQASNWTDRMINKVLWKTTRHQGSSGESKEAHRLRWNIANLCLDRTRCQDSQTWLWDSTEAGVDTELDRPHANPASSAVPCNFFSGRDQEDNQEAHKQELSTAGLKSEEYGGSRTRPREMAISTESERDEVK